MCIYSTQPLSIHYLFFLFLHEVKISSEQSPCSLYVVCEHGEVLMNLLGTFLRHLLIGV